MKPARLPLHLHQVNKEEGERDSFVILSVYVDDIILGSNNLNLLKREKNDLEEHFEMVDQGEIDYILGCTERSRERYSPK